MFLSLLLEGWLLRFCCVLEVPDAGGQAEGIQKVFGLVFKDNETANDFWESQGYTVRTNLNYRNKSMNEKIPTGE